MKNLGWYNGECAAIEEMRVPMADRASWFGDGVYDTAFAHNNVIFALDEHIDRFFRSAAAIEIKPPITKSALSALLSDLSAKVDAKTQLVYWQVTRGTAVRAHVFPDAKPNLWITIKSAEMPAFAPVKLITTPDVRFLICNVKTLNLLPNVLASEAAKRAGAFEAVLHRDGRVTECAHSNVHILKGGVFQTAPADNLILEGVTRNHLIALCKRLGIAVSEKPFTLPELFNADEVMTSSISTFCLQASHIDGKAVGGKDAVTLKKLQDGMLAEFYEATGK